jgi:DNA (cytosine-5)-methyltransferase 1
MEDALDLFAGPGGWDVGALALGVEPLGIEWDDAACATRNTAGLRTMQADVFELDPLEFAPCRLLIGSPPCPTFSNAGGGSGHVVIDIIIECIDALLNGQDTRAESRDRAYAELLPRAQEEERQKATRKGREPDLAKAAVKARREAEMSILVVEPLRWSLALKPRWIALEQVPPVLPIWEKMAEALRIAGWNVWTGCLSSEQFGVPQTRQRAILLADRERLVGPPEPTHQRYVPMPKENGHATLFDPGPRQRIIVAGDEALLPWISMAEALGWVPSEDRPARVLCGHHTPRWSYDQQIPIRTRGEDGSRPTDVFDANDAPSRVVTGKTDSWVVGDGDGLPVEDVEDVALRNGNQENVAVRGLDEPAGTMFFGHRMNDVQWVQRERSGDRSEEGFAPDEMPAQALTSKARSWTVHDGRSDEFNRGPVDPEEQPAPTVGSTARQWQVEGEESPPLVLRTGDNTMSVSRDPEDMEPYERSVDEPAPTLVPEGRRCLEDRARGRAH